MLHQNTLLNARVSELEAQIEIITKRKTRKRKRFQKGGTIEFGVGASYAATEASSVS
jgi:hypothetical protein